MVDLAKCKLMGMNDYMAKPLDERILYSKIMGFVRKKGVLSEIKEENEKIESKGLSCIDLSYLTHRTKSNPELMMQMISIYLDQTPPLIKAMKSGFQDKDWHTLYAAIHKLIPSFAIVGIGDDFENIAKRIQEFASTQNQSNEISEMVFQLENILDQSCRELEIEYNTIKNVRL